MDHVWGVRPCAVSSHNGRFYYSCTCGDVSQCWESYRLAEHMAAAHVPPAGSGATGRRDGAAAG